MGYKLLLADDSITIQKVVSIIFASEECELAIVDNGSAALEKAADILPDIMLVDTLMPGMNGYEVCAKMRQNPALDGIPLLLLTGAFEPFDVDKARESGADDFISKPFESQLLVDKVKSLVQLGKERRASAPVITPAAAAEPAAPVEEPPVWTIDTPASFPVEPATDEPFSFAPDTAAVPAGGAAWDALMPPAGAPAEVPAETFQTVEEPAWAPSPAGFEETSWTVDAAPVEPFTDGPPASEPFPASVTEDDFPGIEEVVDPIIEDEVLAMSSEDDLWGAFQLEPLADDGTHGDVVETYTYSPPSESLASGGEPDAASADAALRFPEITTGWEASEPLAPVAANDSEIPVEPMSETLEVPEASPFPETGSPVDEYAFAAESFVAADVESVPPAEPGGVEAVSPFADSFFFSEQPAEPAPVAEETVPESAGLAAMEELSAAPMAASVEPPAVPEPAAAASAPTVALTEEQLEAMVTRISREVIERIVWEVVPDLAEVLIKEEIRKIKEGR